MISTFLFNLATSTIFTFINSNKIFNSPSAQLITVPNFSQTMQINENDKDKDKDDEDDDPLADVKN